MDLFFPLLLRPLIAICTRSFFQPDEYFQALEPAHRAVFGYGHLTWEWVSDPPIRSIMYPVVWMLPYYITKYLNVHDTSLLIYGPRLLCGVLGSLTDIYMYKLTAKLFGRDYATIALLVSLTSVFHVLALTRTLSNSLETSLTTMALYYWPLSGQSGNHLTKALCIAALSVVIRPTSAILWFFMGTELFLRTYQNQRSVIPLLSRVFGVGSCIIALLLGVDSLYFGRLTFTPLNFLRVNASSVSSFYGANNWHYYLSQALPVVCTTALPFVLHGAWLAYNLPGPVGQASRTLLGATLWTVLIYSLSSHKEWRFIHPILPVLHILASRSLVDLYRQHTKHSSTSAITAHLPILPTHLTILLLTLPGAFYVVFFHSRAQLDVLWYLRSIGSDNLKSVGFLMPCHSTPWQAYLHRPEIELWAVGCEPPLRGQPLKDYRDQTAVFYHDPLQYLVSRFPEEVDPLFPRSRLPSSPPGDSLRNDWEHSWPSHLAFFGALLEADERIPKLLTTKQYRLEWSSDNGWEEDERRRGGIQVWSWHSDP